MSTEIRPEEHSKRDRIVNALAAYPDRYERDASVIAELADASTSYAYRILDEIDENELTADDVEAARDDDLQDHYRQRLGELLEKHDVARSIEEAGDEERVNDTTEERVRHTMADADEPESETDAVAVESIAHVQERMKQYRDDAKFEREHFEGSAVNIAHGKFLVADRAIELLDQAIDLPSDQSG